MKKLADYLRRNDWAPACAFVVFASWLAVHLPHSFWRDEGITSWLASGSWAELLERTRRFAGWMLLHGALSKLFYALPGPAEFALRLPSLAAALVSLRLAFLIGRKAGKDALAGWLAVLCLASMRMFEIPASEARPYALTLMCSLAAALSFINLADEGGRKHAALWAIFSACAVYFHLMAGLAAAAQALYGLWLWRRDGDGMKRLGAGLALFALLLLPLAGVILYFPARSVVFLSQPRPWDIFKLLFPLEIICGLAAAFLFVPKPSAAALKDRLLSVGAAVLAATWLLPVLALFLVSYFTDLRVFISRYAMASTASGAILAGLAIRAIEPRKFRLAAVCGIMAVSAGRSAVSAVIHPDEDWRSAAAEANALLRPGDAFVLQSPLVESTDRAGLADPEKRKYLCSILSPYPVRAECSVIPVFITGSDGAYLQDRIAGAAEGKDRLLFMSAEKEAQAELFSEAALKAGFSRTRFSLTPGSSPILRRPYEHR